MALDLPCSNKHNNLISHQIDIDEIFLKAKDPYEAKHEFLINKGESVGSKHYNDLKAFIDYLKENIAENIDEYNQNEKRKILTVFDDIITDIFSNKKVTNNKRVFY